MARIAPLERDDAPPEIRDRYDEQIQQHGRVTNMKRTLGNDALAYDALMMWYPLRERVASFLGDRDTYIFAHAISDENDCLICSTFFRRIFIDAGQDPDTPEPSERQKVLIEYGRQLARDPRGVDDALYASLARELTPPQIVALTAFGGVMIATNAFNDALRVDLDEDLYPYRAPSVAGEVAQ
jgi:alkylhydroperoxidase family enzyme